MAVTVTWTDSRDAARTVDALLEAADVEVGRGRLLLAKRYRRMAEELADACDLAPLPRWRDPAHV